MTPRDGAAGKSSAITRLLNQVSRGNREAEAELAALVYNQLHRRAEGYLRRERAGHTLQATALVHEVWIRLVNQRISWKNRGQFYGIAARQMRRVLIDHWKHKKVQAHGGAQVPVDPDLMPSEGNPESLLALDEALDRLAERNARQAKVVDLQFFLGCSQEEIARMLGVSVRTVKLDWRIARAWLHAYLGKEK